MDAATVHRRRWLILGVLSVSVFLVVVDNTIVNVALPTLNRELGASVSQLQWIVDAYSLVFAGLLLAAGGLGDRLGRKGAMQIGLVLFGVTSALGAFATSSGQLIAARGAMGIGAALVFPATLAILTNVFTEPTERAKAIGAWSAVSGLAIAFGPVTGGFLLEHFWWGSVFLVNVPIVIVALVGGALLVPSSRDPEVGRFDVIGMLLSISGISLLVYTVIEGPRWGWTSTTALLGFTGAALLLVAFVAWELRVSKPLLDVRIFKVARFTAAATAIALAFFALVGFIFLMTQYFQFVKGYSTLSAGVHTLPFAIFAGVTAPVGARFALRWGPRRVVSGGLLLMAVGLFVASTLDQGTAYFGPTIVSMALLAVGLSLVTAPATEAVMSSLPKEKAGAGAAVNDTTRELGGTLGVAVVGSVFASVYGPRIGDFLGQYPVPAEAVAAAKESVAAALSVASQAPAELQGSFAHAASSAFVEGMSRGSIVAAGVSLLGAVIAALFLPGRLTAEEVTDLTAMGSFPGLDELAPDLDEVAPDLDELAPEPA
jgi:DHA2 family multidrug resistance protein-like MFS transporter